jgi:hypothetical protein
MRLKNHPDNGWGMVQFLMYAQDLLGPGSSFAVFIWPGHNQHNVCLVASHAKLWSFSL